MVPLLRKLSPKKGAARLRRKNPWIPTRIGTTTTTITITRIITTGSTNTTRRWQNKRRGGPSAGQRGINEQRGGLIKGRLSKYGYKKHIQLLGVFCRNETSSADQNKKSHSKRKASIWGDYGCPALTISVRASPPSRARASSDSLNANILIY